MNKSIKKIETDAAPKAIGPYSQAIDSGYLVFISGQIPLDPVNQKMVSGGIRSQTRQVIDNIEAILKETGLTLAAVIKTELFLRSMDDFKEVNEIYAERFNRHIKPARQVVAVAGLPMNAQIEMSCIAAKAD